MQSLENVYLLPVPTLLGLSRFPSHYEAGRKKLLVQASDVPPYAQVLFVSHPWESPGNPDPSGRQFSALTKFLDESKQKKEVGGGGGGRGGEGFGYVWAAFSCMSSNRMKPTFKTHLENVLTVSLYVVVFSFSVRVERVFVCVCVPMPLPVPVYLNLSLHASVFVVSFFRLSSLSSRRVVSLARVRGVWLLSNGRFVCFDNSF